MSTGKKIDSTQHGAGKVNSLLVTNNADACIGAGTNGRAKVYCFDGLIDDIKIWKGRVVNVNNKYVSQWKSRKNKFLKRMALFDDYQKQKAAKLEKQALDEYKKFFRKNIKSPETPFIASNIINQFKVSKKKLRI